MRLRTSNNLLGTLPDTWRISVPLPGVALRLGSGVVRQRHMERRRRYEPRRVHRQFQGSDRAARGRVLPAALPPLGERRGAPPPAPKAPGGAGRRHQGRGPLPRSPPGHHGRGGNGNGQDLHRGRRSAHGGLPEGAHTLPAAPGPQVEEGGGDDGARRPRRHRRVHHRPGDAALLHRLRSPVRGDEQGEGQAVLPLEGRRHRAVGDIEGQAHQDGGDG